MHLNTIGTGDRGVFEALDFGVPDGCACAARVILKVWTDAADDECIVEDEVYETLDECAVKGVPALRATGQDVASDVYVLALEKLGPSLQQLLDLVPDGKLDEKMVMALAIQLVSSLFFMGGIQFGRNNRTGSID